ncbi:hypothetical protein CY34DRAFT_809747, partial [Suillus luteus UH-Slu-Lm8-n1]
DIAFLQDATGSQQPYIDTARNEINQICNTLISGGKFAPQDLRFGLIAFRDHPPQDQSFVTQVFPFTTDFGVVASNLGGLVATGGGDGPEAQSDALSDALKVDWKDNTTKIVVLITDSPPHGIGEDVTDARLENDPLRIATRMGKLGITLVCRTFRISRTSG